MSSSALPYVGSRISLISKSEIRYEGILYVINTEESTIALQNVRSFGTEGRTSPDVPACEEVYDFIIFRGEDIKDLTILEGSSTTTKPSQRAVLEDPAVVSVGPERKSAPQVNSNTVGAAAPQRRSQHQAQHQHQSQHRPQQQHNQVTTSRPYKTNNGSNDRYEKRPQYSSHEAPHQRHSHGNAAANGGSNREYNNKPNREYSQGGKGHGKGSTNGHQNGGYHNRRPYNKSSNSGPVGELNASENAQTKALVSEEFDFTKSADTMDKPADIPQDTTGYNKTKSFFDSISCDATQRTTDQAANRFDRAARDKQREIDQETFGTAALSRPFGYSGGPHRRHYQNSSRAGGPSRPQTGRQSQKAY